MKSNKNETNWKQKTVFKLCAVKNTLGARRVASHPPASRGYYMPTVNVIIYFV